LFADDRTEDLTKDVSDILDSRIPKAQKDRLEQEVHVRNRGSIFYPKLHCELNIIEQFRGFMPEKTVSTVWIFYGKRFQLH
jgi:hypothetical protein